MATTTKTKHEELYDAIVERLREDGAVQVTTYLKSTVYDKRHVDWFKFDVKGVYVRSGKRWDCISLCSIRFGRRAN